MPRSSEKPLPPLGKAPAQGMPKRKKKKKGTPPWAMPAALTGRVGRGQDKR